MTIGSLQARPDLFAAGKLAPPRRRSLYADVTPAPSPVLAGPGEREAGR